MKRTKSGHAWMQEHVSDAFVKKAQQAGFRSRAAFKLLEIDRRDQLIKPGMVVVDLGAAPGSWSQVVTQKLAGRGRVLAIDLLPMAPLPGVAFWEGDFASDAGLAWLTGQLQGQAVDLVLSDMAPNLSGVTLRDQARHYELCELAMEFALKNLQPNGAFLVKAFHGVGFEDFRRRMRASFEAVHVRKPEASRDRSAEVYLLGRRPVKADGSGLE